MCRCEAAEWIITMNQFMKCPACAYLIPDDSKFCPICGSMLVLERPTAQPIPEEKNDEKAKAPIERAPARSTLRLTAADVRSAIVMSEIISPPLAKRRR